MQVLNKPQRYEHDRDLEPLELVYVSARKVPKEVWLETRKYARAPSAVLAKVFGEHFACLITRSMTIYYTIEFLPFHIKYNRK